MDAWIRDSIAGRLAPALAVGVFNRDRVLHVRGYGDAGAGSTPRPCGAATPFRWFSVTKVLTATCVMALVERGALSLEDRVADRLGWFTRVDPNGHARIADLVAHTSGLGNPAPFRWGRPVEASGWDVEAEVRTAVERRGAIRERSFGKYRYTNLGYLVLGEVVRSVTGWSLEDVARDEVLSPLGMQSARFGPDPNRPYDTAPPHEPVWHPRPWIFAGGAGSVRRFLDGKNKAFLRVHPFKLLGTAFGDLVASVDDVARFGRAHLCDGRLDGVRVLRASSARAMRERALGWQRGRDARGEIVLHTGSGIGYRSELRLHPGLGLGVAVVANAGHLATGPVVDALFDAFSVPR